MRTITSAPQARALLASTAFLLLAMTVLSPSFRTPASIEVMAMGFVLEAIVALAMTFVIVSGGIDLSVGAVLPFSGICAALLLKAGYGALAAVGLSLGAAAGVGLVNAWLIGLLRVHPFMPTLATMLVLKGVNLAITAGAPISGLPASFTWIGQGRLGPAPVPLVLWAALACALGYLLRHHRLGQQVYFVGANPHAATASGVAVHRVRAGVYVLSAVCAGLAGLVATAQYGSVSVGYGQNVELRVITAVVIGGARLSGGRGAIGDTVTGVAFLAALAHAFAASGVSTYWQDVVSGAMVLVAVLAGRAIGRPSGAAA